MKNTFSVLFAAISAGIAGLAALLLVLFLGGWIPYLSINSSPLVALAPTIDVLFVGMGAEMAHLPADLRRELEDAGVGV